jgi:hypothetical protein
MSTEVIGVFDQGFAVIKDEKGQPMNVNVFVFRTVTNAAAPENVLAFCNPVYKESVMKSLRRLFWVKPEGSESGSEMVKRHNNGDGTVTVNTEGKEI